MLWPVLCVTAYEGTESLSGQHMIECSEGNKPQKDQVCMFQDTWLGDKCQKNEQWGYKLDSPCVLLKINKVGNDP